MRSRDRDRGVTLIELLVAVTLMAVAFGAVFGGIGLLFKVQSVQKANSTIDVQLRNYAEKVRDLAYVACPTANQTSYSAAPKPTGLTTTVAVQFFAGTYGASAANFTNTCGTSDFGMQRITVTMTDARGVSGSLTFGKTP